MGFNPCDTCTADDAETEGDSCEDCEFNNIRAEYDAAEVVLYKIENWATECSAKGVNLSAVQEIRELLKEWGG